MRAAVVIALFFVTISLARAQEQEQKLVDRLLKPNMSLQNPEQNKQFTAGGDVMTKKAPTRWFFFRKRTEEKQFANVKEFHAKDFATNKSQLGGKQADTSTRTKLAKLDEPYATRAFETQAAGDANKVEVTRDYADVRPFLAKGKSQKSLSAQNHQMTIDEVRELLNKNK